MPGALTGLDIYLLDEEIIGFFSKEIARMKKAS
jgi:hypothetical protein